MEIEYKYWYLMELCRICTYNLTIVWWKEEKEDCKPIDMYRDDSSCNYRMWRTGYVFGVFAIHKCLMRRSSHSEYIMTNYLYWQISPVGLGMSIVYP